MKKLDLFVLKSFLGPFIMTFLIVLFVLMMQFLWLYIDELVGKGLSLGVILEFLGWGSATLFPLALPLATLLASIMTMGSFGENNELLAMKAAGIPLLRILAPLMVLSLFISVAAFFASNNLIPVAYEKIYLDKNALKEVNEMYTVYDYQKDCRLKIKEIEKKGKIPIILSVIIPKITSSVLTINNSWLEVYGVTLMFK